MGAHAPKAPADPDTLCVLRGVPQSVHADDMRAMLENAGGAVSSLKVLGTPPL